MRKFLVFILTDYHIFQIDQKKYVGDKDTMYVIDEFELYNLINHFKKEKEKLKVYSLHNIDISKLKL
jgi:hypothetical protein